MAGVKRVVKVLSTTTSLTKVLLTQTHENHNWRIAANRSKVRALRWFTTNMVHGASHPIPPINKYIILSNALALRRLRHVITTHEHHRGVKSCRLSRPVELRHLISHPSKTFHSQRSRYSIVTAHKLHGPVKYGLFPPSGELSAIQHLCDHNSINFPLKLLKKSVF